MSKEKMKKGLSSSPFGSALSAIISPESKSAKPAEYSKTGQSRVPAAPPAALKPSAKTAGPQKGSPAKPAAKPQNPPAENQGPVMVQVSVAGVVRSVYFEAQLLEPAKSLCGHGNKYPSLNKLVNIALKERLEKDGVLK